MSTPIISSVQPKTRQQWRNWLQKNHLSAKEAWLIYYKKSSGKFSLSYNDAVEEALCFGWIDSVCRSFDEERTAQRFSPRKPKSKWSPLNKIRVKTVMATGLMTPAGLDKIEAAKKDGSWDKLHLIYATSEELVIPEDLQKAMNKSKKASTHFSAFPLTIRRQFLVWISTAKQPEARKARIKQTVLMAAANKKPGSKGLSLLPEA